MPARTQRAYQHVKHIQCRRRHKMQLNMCYNFFVLLTCVEQTDNLPTSKQNAFQHVLTKRLICQRGHNIRVHASGETNCISTFFDQTHQVPAKPPNAGRDKKCNSTSVDLTHAIPAWAQYVYQLNPSFEKEMHLKM